MRALKILIVDDSAMMRALIKRAVKLTDLDIGELYEAENGRRALDVLDTRQVDAVLTDINMPEMNGVELLREIVRRGVTDLVKVVVSTDGSAARRDEVRDLGVTAYIDKPFAPEIIRDVLIQCHPSVVR
ncbi:MAG TPA: response regulator [Vicinamibacterales bacterium]|nr:response regulator [Vicinamibacterales bacterium]